MPLTPNVLWAQRVNCIYLTLDVQDVKVDKLELENVDDGKTGVLHFKGTGTGSEGTPQEYELDLNLYKAVNKDDSKINVTPRRIFCIIEKADDERWPRLTKESGKAAAHIKVDWSHWVDSDDEGEEDDVADKMGGDFSGFGGGAGGMANMLGGGGPGGMDMASMLQGMGGAGGAGGMDMASMLQGMGGAGGAGGMDMEAMAKMFGKGGAGGEGAEGMGGEEDSDDEDLPDLESA